MYIYSLLTNLINKYVLKKVQKKPKVVHGEDYIFISSCNLQVVSKVGGMRLSPLECIH